MLLIFVGLVDVPIPDMALTGVFLIGCDSSKERKEIDLSDRIKEGVAVDGKGDLDF